MSLQPQFFVFLQFGTKGSRTAHLHPGVQQYNFTNSISSTLEPAGLEPGSPGRGVFSSLCALVSASTVAGQFRAIFQQAASKAFRKACLRLLLEFAGTEEGTLGLVLLTQTRRKCLAERELQLPHPLPASQGWAVGGGTGMWNPAVIGLVFSFHAYLNGRKNTYAKVEPERLSLTNFRNGPGRTYTQFVK